MKNLIPLVFILIPFLFISQDNFESDEEESKGNLFFGLNLGGFKANKNTALMYNGGYSYHQDGTINTGYYGANYYFNDYTTRVALDQYFKYNYAITSYATPSLMRYRTAFNVGGHAGINIGSSLALYADVNILKLKIEDYFTVAINNPNDFTLIAEPELEQIPVFGEESRTNLNLGLQFYLYEEESLKTYFNLFGNVNTSKLEKNYFVINNVTYQIRHNNTINGQTNGVNNFVQNQSPNGVGYGAGAGLGVKYRFNETFTFDFNYSAAYTRTKMYPNLKPFGLNHTLVARIIWGW